MVEGHVLGNIDEQSMKRMLSHRISAWNCFALIL